MRIVPAGLLLLSLLCGTLHSSAEEMVTAKGLKDRADVWFTTDEGKQQIGNMISWQTPEGGWTKGYDASHPHAAGESYGEWGAVGTIDNNYTYTEVRFLAHAYKLTQRTDALDAADRGIDFLFKAQYPNGGWPQRFPLEDNYGRDITFNDGAMTAVMRLMEEIGDGRGDFAFVDEARRAKAKDSFTRGMDCILKSQVRVNDKLTAWGQQYDPKTLLPSLGRAYELPSLTADESAGIVLFLMDEKAPSSEIKKAIHAAVTWFDASKITGIRLDQVKEPKAPKGYDLVVVADPAAKPIWARFYEIDTNRPFYCGRDGVKKYSLAEIELERRVGYAWLRPWGTKVLSEYQKWCKRMGETPVVGK